MLARHPDDPVAVQRDMRVGELRVGDVAHTISFRPERLVVERAVHPEIIVLPINQPILAQAADSLRGLDVERDVASELLSMAI